MATKITTPEYRAEARFQRSSPQKTKLVLDLIKGKHVEAALGIVSFTNKKMAPVVESVLRSAVQNAVYLSDERGLDLDIDRLYVKTAVANEGPRLKRLRPAPMGRAFRYQRRLTHVIITVAERPSGTSGGQGTAPTIAAKAADGKVKIKANTHKPATDSKPVTA